MVFWGPEYLELILELQYAILSWNIGLLFSIVELDLSAAFHDSSQLLRSRRIRAPDARFRIGVNIARWIY